MLRDVASAVAQLRASGSFDADWYLQTYRDVALAGIDPHEHYVRFGRGLGRAMSGADVEVENRLGLDRRVASQASVSNTVSHLSRASEIERKILSLPLPSRESAEIDVIVPVYRSIEESLSCLWHVLQGVYRTRYDLVVIDDCSPEPELSRALRRIADAGYITLLVNDENLGFIKTCNKGMNLHPERDVVLLNSDTETYGDWLDRIVDVARNDPACSTVTPLTNNGEICSYPVFVKDNPAPLEISFAELDQICAEVNRGRAVIAPTGVGFCMFIKREVLDKIGLLDAETFGRGYGEENDLCLRGQAAGYHDLIAGGVFVRHLGSVSFQGEKAKLIRKNLQALNARWPEYHREVMRFIEVDPVRPMREALDVARLRSQRRKRNVLVVSLSGRGGGTEQHTQEEIVRLEEAGFGVFRMRAERAGECILHHHAATDSTPNLAPLHLYHDADRILDMWNFLGITEVHVHHLIDFGPDGAQHMTALLKRAGLPYRVILHDYYSICPRVTLHGVQGAYCGEPADPMACNDCLATNGSIWGSGSIEQWRACHQELLVGADLVIAPDGDVISRMARYMPKANYVVRPHEILEVAALHRSIRNPGNPIRVVAQGAISEIKGFYVLEACALHARKNNLPISYHVVGYTMDDLRAEAAGITVTGRYANELALHALRAARPDIVFQSSVWPETYSYTLSVALLSGLPIVAFDIGAPARRLREIGMGCIFPLEDAFDPAAINRRMMEIAETSVITEV